MLALWTERVYKKEVKTLKPYEHAVNSAKMFGGIPEDYLDIHELMDISRTVCGDMRHRVLTHHMFFVQNFLVRIFGSTLINFNKGMVSVADIGEQHIKDDYDGQLPNPSDWIEAIEVKPWMAHCADGNLPPSAKGLAPKAESENDSPKPMMSDGNPYHHPMMDDQTSDLSESAKETKPQPKSIKRFNPRDFREEMRVDGVSR